MKICVVTSNTAAAEPRAPRHAIAAKLAFPDAEVILIDLLQAERTQRPDPVALAAHGIGRMTLRYPTRKSAPLALAARKARTEAARALFSLTGLLSEAAFGDSCQGFSRALVDYPADLYIAHNADTLYPSFKAAERHGAKVAFDCMEFYSEMGDSQSSVEARAIRALETRYMRRCALVIASSDTLAEALQAEYGIARPLAAYNTPPRTDDLAPRQGGGLNLYWRNNTVGLGQRGLEEALVALTMLPDDVRLSVQGHPPADGGAAVQALIERLGVTQRVTVLPPFVPEQAVRLASLHDVGLCLERRGPRNHELTVSNKLFDYHMAGLAVISSDMPSLAEVLARSGGGLTYVAGDPSSLAAAALQLYEAPDVLASLQAKARSFALEEANMETELDHISKALREVMGGA